MADADDDLPERFPPTAGRVAARALVLSAVSCRAMLEADPEVDAARDFWNRVLQWFQGLEISSELEPDEATLLEAPLGTLGSKEAIDGSWRSEGMAVLAWALGRYALPPHDEIVAPRAVADQLGFLRARQETVLEASSLRALDELEAYCDVAFTVHWRVREFALQGKAMNFAEFATTAWFGPMSLAGVRLIENDLAVGEVPIARAPVDDFRRVQSIAAERHHAANWVTGQQVLYSDVDTNT